MDGSGKPLTKFDCNSLTEPNLCTGNKCHYKYAWIESNWTNVSCWNL